MANAQPDKVVFVLRYRDQTDRFYGKFKDFETGKWVKIPGGAFPPEFDTEAKAKLFANIWYKREKAVHDARLAAEKPPAEATWDDICDAYLEDVHGRIRGKESCRYEATSITNGSIRKGVLAVGKPSDNDENRCVVWLRSIVEEDISRVPGVQRFRKPMTVRNTAKHLRFVFKFAMRLKLIPGLTTNPTLGDEFQDELKGIVAKADQRDWLCPVESVVKLVSCPEVPVNRRIVYLTLALTGLRPGELAGLQLHHLQRDGEMQFFTVEQQITLARGKGGRKRLIDKTLKTKWSNRVVPIHAALQGPLDAWLTSGWKAWVGRDPKAEDFVFPDESGEPMREERGDRFRSDLTTAWCSKDYDGVELRPYSLRHTFSTLLTEGEAADAAHDRLMGHRPKDTKNLRYSAKQLRYLATAVAKMRFELPVGAPSFGGPSLEAESER